MEHSLKVKGQNSKPKTKKRGDLDWCNKLFPTFVSSIPHHENVVRTALKYTFFIGILVFLFLNVFLSQYVPPLYFQFMNDGQNAAAYYLQLIRPLHQFSSELARLSNIYGKGLEDAAYGREIEEKILIQNYEQILQKNPYARDILLRLFSMYIEKGDKKLALEYLQRAKEVDPSLKPF